MFSPATAVPELGPALAVTVLVRFLGILGYQASAAFPGKPHPALAATSAGRGVLLRLLIGETIPMLLRDDDLVLTICLAAPRQARK